MIDIETVTADTARSRMTVAIAHDPRIGHALQAILHRIDDASRSGKNEITNPFDTSWHDVTYDRNVGSTKTKNLTERDMNTIVRVLRSRGFTIEPTAMTDGSAVMHCPIQRVTW
jgi:hypothetical protein